MDSRIQPLGAPFRQLRQKRAAAPQPPAAPASVGGAAADRAEGTVQVQSGETFYTLAAKHLGDPRRWVELYELNKQAVGANPNLLWPGMKLVLPKPHPDPQGAGDRIAAYAAGRGIGQAIDNGGGAGAHDWHGLVVQDFGGGSETEGKAMVVDGPAGPRLVRNAFYQAFLAENNHMKLGAPLEEEHWEGDHVVQRFEHGEMRWSPEEGARVLPKTGAPASYPPPGKPAPAPAGIDPRIAAEARVQLGVQDRTTGPDGQLAVTSVRYQDDRQSGGNHNVYVRVLDPQGRPIPPQDLARYFDVRYDNGSEHSATPKLNDAFGVGQDAWTTGSPSGGPTPGYFDIPMYGGGAQTSVWIRPRPVPGNPYAGYGSQQVGPFSMPGNHHVNYMVTFQARPGTAANPAPVAAPPAAPAAPVPTTGVAQGDRPLALAEYPPANPVGAHGIPNYLQSSGDVDHVLDLLGKSGAKNTLLIVPFPNPSALRDVDREFLQKAKERGITVQLRLGWDFKPGNAIDAEALKRFTREVTEVQGHGPYLALGNEPNLHHEWAHGQKPDAAAFARWWAPLARAVAEAGGHPGLPGLAAGAWNTPDGGAKQEFEFYEQMIKTIATEDPGSLDRAWTGAHPYHMYYGAGHPDYVEDAYWQLEKFNALNKQYLGRSLPVLVTESGYVDGENARRFDPGNADQARDVARMKASLSRRPPWLVVGTADWTLSNRHGEGAWRGVYGPNGETSAYSQVFEAEKGQWEHLEDEVRG